MNDQDMFDAIIKDLDQAESEIDSVTLARLRQIRSQAVDSTVNSSASGWINWIMPAMSVSATALIAVLAINIQLMSPEQEDIMAAMNDLEIISAEESLALYQDLEFYEWLSYQAELEGKDLG
jgi:hypothetical protein